MKKTDKDELAKWMKEHGIDQKLRLWVANDIAGASDYTILEDLATVGVVNIQIQLTPYGNLAFQQIPYVPPPPEPELEPSIEVVTVEETPKPKKRRAHAT